MSRANREVVTFKADRGLLDALKGVSNRSQFIRDAILAALANLCPLCSGSGIMTPGQHKHWKTFAEGHSLRRCDQCREMYLTCSKDRPGRGASPAASAHKARRQRKADRCPC
ncbi:MAG: ribbon-helix-helix domain-containing protein [Planctomycetota bacterium]|jgi:hypothetical protein